MKTAKAKSKTAQVRDFLTKKPNANAKDVAVKFGVSAPLVYAVLRHIKEQAEKAAQEAPVESGPTWTAPSDGQNSTVTASAPKNEVEEVLRERGGRYGPFENHAKITQMIKDVMRAEPGWERLTYPQREALEMVAHKIGRMLNGDPTYEDNVVDILGYTDLMLRCMRGKDEL